MKSKNILPGKEAAAFFRPGTKQVTQLDAVLEQFRKKIRELVQDGDICITFGGMAKKLGRTSRELAIHHKRLISPKFLDYAGVLIVPQNKEGLSVDPEASISIDQAFSFLSGKSAGYYISKGCNGVRFEAWIKLNRKRGEGLLRNLSERVVAAKSNNLLSAGVQKRLQEWQDRNRTVA